MTSLSPFARTRTAPQLSLWLLFPLFFAAVDVSHWTLLRLPYFWDEGGYYIPAALDFFRTGTLIPQSTTTNAHPPLPSILLAAWWHIAGTGIVNTRTLGVLTAAAALLGVFCLARALAGETVATLVTLLTALYPIWFAQSTLAHADIFAAAFTLWALSSYFQRFQQQPGTPRFTSVTWGMALLFALAALSKETAIINPLALAAWEVLQLLRKRPASATWALALILPVLPLIAWYAFHFHKTGFVFGNPEFLRYNATANLNPHRITLCLYHRLLHLTAHMNLFVPVACTLAIVLWKGAPRLSSETGFLMWADHYRNASIPKPALQAITIILFANWLEFSILGGALLTRYLLPMYPLSLLVCVAEWHRRLSPRQVKVLCALTGAAFLCGLWVNPPYAFAPEDNLTYRDMIVLHQRAIAVLACRFPSATVLTAWPAAAELTRPELGYTDHIFAVKPILNFSFAEMQKAAGPENHQAMSDTALLFSTKWEPPPGKHNLSRSTEPTDTRYFDFHHDLRPAEAAAFLHGEVVWQQTQGGEWAAVLQFPRLSKPAKN